MNLRNLWRRWTGIYPPDDESEGIVFIDLKPKNPPRNCITDAGKWQRHLYKGKGSCVRCGIADPRQGQLTKAKKRAEAGMCPHCKRTFQKVQRHIANKHTEAAS